MMIRSYIVLVRKPLCELNKFCVNRILDENLIPENTSKPPLPCGVRSKVMIPLLLIKCFSNCLWGCLVNFLVMHYFFLSFLFCNHLDGEERTGCFTLIVFLISCDILFITLCLSCFAIILIMTREQVVLP